MSPTRQAVPALILGKHITALGVLRVLSGDGIETRCIDAARDMINRSRWYRPAQRLLTETTDSDALATYLDAFELPTAVLMACSDRWTTAVAGLPPATRSRFPASVSSREVVEQFIDKARFRTLVERLGIPAPRSLPIQTSADLDRATDEELAGGFLKPTDSQTYARQFGTKGSFVANRAEAVKVLDAGTAAGVTFMLQEWIPGGSSSTILLDGFVDRHGTVMAIVARRRLRMDPPKLANTASDVTIPLSDVEAAVASTRRLLAAVGYRGVFNVEYKFDARDGRFKIIEVNARPFWMIAHIAKAGVDLPFMSYLDAQGLPVPQARGYQIGRYGLYELPDAAAIIRALGSRRRPNGPVVRPWLLGDHAAFWWADPLPGLEDFEGALRRRLGGLFARPQRAT